MARQLLLSLALVIVISCGSNDSSQAPANQDTTGNGGTVKGCGYAFAVEEDPKVIEALRADLEGDWWHEMGGSVIDTSPSDGKKYLYELSYQGRASQGRFGKVVRKSSYPDRILVSVDVPPTTSVKFGKPLAGYQDGTFRPLEVKYKGSESCDTHLFKKDGNRLLLVSGLSNYFEGTQARPKDPLLPEVKDLGYQAYSHVRRIP